MKYVLCVFMALSFCFLQASYAQSYQPQNNQFELWDNTDVSAEPLHWNSFATSDGSLASMASSPHHYHRHGGRPGTTGGSYVTLYTKSILGIKANGNMTTGRIHASSMSPANEGNYNYTKRSSNDFSQPFLATPDSLYVWVSFYASAASSEASITAYLHGDVDFRDPNDVSSSSLYAGVARAQFSRTTSSASSLHWTRIQVPFVYSGTASPHYLLISITTNKTPAAGAANDSISVDDLEFIYSAWLNAIHVNGSPLAGFEKGRFDYSLGHITDSNFHGLDIDVESEVPDVTIRIDSTYFQEYQPREGAPEVTDTLQGLRYDIHVLAEDQTTEKIYHLSCYLDNIDSLVVVGGITLPCCDNDWILYPNPTRGRVLLRTAQRGRVELLSAAGRRLLSMSAPVCGGIVSIDLTPYPKGVYFVRQGNRVMKVVKL